MLLAVSGSQGAGKTTVLTKLQQAGYPVIERKTSRSILSDWGVTLSEVNNNRELTIKFQDEILKRKLADELDAAFNPDIFLTERTFTDLFVYALVAIGKDNEYSDWLDDYYLRCVEAQKSYGEVFYLTAGHFQPVHDGVRGVNKHYSEMVDLIMSRYTMKMTPVGNLRFIDTSVLDERVRVITTSIHNHHLSNRRNK